MRILKTSVMPKSTFWSLPQKKWYTMKNILSLLILLSAFAVNSNASVVPDTLSYPAEMIVMPVPEYEVETTASEDGNMKLYNWNVDGFNEHETISGIVCQFRTGKGKIKSVRLDKHGWGADTYTRVKSLNALKKNDGSTYYIVLLESHNYDGMTVQYMNAIAIKGDTIKEVSVYDGGKDLDDCGMEVSFDSYDWYSKTMDEIPAPFNYYPDTRELYVPQAIGNSLTDRYYVYRFNGNEFVKAGLQPNRGLHSSLHNYSRLVKYGKAEYHKFRIDEMEDGKLRYASWYERSEMSEEPDIILHNGVYDEKENAYTFANGNYHYIVTEEEIIIKYKGKIQNRHKMKNFW